VCAFQTHTHTQPPTDITFKCMLHLLGTCACTNKYMVTDLRTGTQYFDEAFPAFVSYFVQIAHCNLLCQLLCACACGQIRVILCDSSCTNRLFSSSEKEGVWNRGSWGSRAVGQEREGSFIFAAKGFDGLAVGRDCYPASAGTTGSFKSALAIAKRCPVIGHARP
jgi:hypothetical protein